MIALVKVLPPARPPDQLQNPLSIQERVSGLQRCTWECTPSTAVLLRLGNREQSLGHLKHLESAGLALERRVA